MGPGARRQVGGGEEAAGPPTSRGLSSAPPDATPLMSGGAMWDRTPWGPAYEEQRGGGSHCADLIFSTVCPGSCSGKCHPHALLTRTGAPSHSPPQPSQPSARTGSNCPSDPGLLLLGAVVPNSTLSLGLWEPPTRSWPCPSQLLCIGLPHWAHPWVTCLLGVPPQHRPECQTTKGKDPKCSVPDQLSWCPQAL